MGEGVRDRAVPGRALRLAPQRGSRLARALFDTDLSSRRGHPRPTPAEAQPGAEELGARGLPAPSLISWRGIWDVPSPTET